MNLNDFLTKLESIKDNVPTQHIDTLNFFKLELKEDENEDPSGYVEQLNICNFSSLVQKVTIPDITETPQQAESIFGKHPAHSLIVFPTSNELTMDVINTREAEIDKIFNEWLHEVHSVRWVGEVPYSTIEIHVSLSDHTDVEYVFVNCRPTSMKSHMADQQLRNNITREITFAFDYMYMRFPKDDLINTLVDEMTNQSPEQERPGAIAADVTASGNANMLKDMEQNNQN